MSHSYLFLRSSASVFRLFGASNNSRALGAALNSGARHPVSLNLGIVVRCAPTSSRSHWSRPASQDLGQLTRSSVKQGKLGELGVSSLLFEAPKRFCQQGQLARSAKVFGARRPFHWWAAKAAPQEGLPSLAAAGKAVSMGLGAPLLTYFGIDLGIQVAGWAYSYWQQTDKFYDLTGSLTYLTLAGLSVSRSSLGPHQLLLTGMVGLWAARLGSFLYARVLHAGKDDRLDRVKSQPGTFLLYWTIQAVWVFVVALPMLLVNSAPAAPVSSLVYVGAGVWALGFSVEAIADQQKDRFRRNPDNQGKWIDSGLWRYSRHPNYFGEITLWTGAAICAASILPPLPAAACFLSPLLSYHLTCNVSGLPLVEKSAHKRWGSDPAYQAYLRETSAVIPWFRKSNGS